MRRTDAIVVVSMFGVVLVIAGLFLAGHSEWGGRVIQGLTLVGVVLVIIRAIFGRKGSASRPIADSGSVVNDLYLGTTYTGPRHVEPPRETYTELIIDDRRPEYLTALDDADSRPQHGSDERSGA